MEIRRFGVGHRRPDGPPGTIGVAAQVIHSDGRGVIAELAFARHASIVPHANPNTAWFLVVEGGGFVQVGEERARVAAGEAVAWPAGLLHSAWTELSEMRAIVVELAGADDALLRGVLEIAPGDRPDASGASDASDRPVERGEARPVEPSADDRSHSAIEGEPA